MILRSILVIALIAPSALFSQGKDLNLPDLGDRVSGVISLEQEKLLVKVLWSKFMLKHLLLMIL